MSTFFDEIAKYNWDDVKSSIYSKNASDVKLALSKDRIDLDDFMSLISPAAQPFIEEMAQKSMRLTQARFGKTIQLYIPLYLSNYCENSCVYCGFNHANKMTRKVLSYDEIKAEIEVIKSYGYKHILLVTGEAPKKAGVEYLNDVIKLLKKEFSQIAIEVQPLDTDEYQKLHDSGLNFVCVYQETYNQDTYPNYHPKGRKSDYRYRVETPDRCGEAGIHKIGLGVLLGLEDWRVDTLFVASHLRYLQKQYWKTKYSISLPRLRPHAGSFEPNSIVGDRDMVQLICAYRLLEQEIEISISTREPKEFRDNIIKLGVTSYSADSSTEPGGYIEKNAELEQFAIDDNRSTAEVAQMIRDKGYEPVWKDWDASMQ